jgi:hypothetical protein
MLVVLVIQITAQCVNFVGILALIGIIPGRNSTDWKMANEIYRSLLVLFCFLNIIKIFGLVWVGGLVWKLKTLGHTPQKELFSSNENADLNQHQHVPGNPHDRETSFFGKSY